VKLLARTREWKRLLPAADLVLADALAADTLRAYRPKRLREFRVLTEAGLLRLKQSLARVAPPLPGRRG
jgi:hypothetical protein